MKKAAVWLGLLLMLACSAPAQISVEVKLDQEHFLPGESLPVAVRVTNRSGRTLELGQDNQWLTLAVESREGSVVEKLAEVPVEGEFSLQTSKTAVKRLDLAPYFTLGTLGGYSITATVRIKEWGQEVNSRPTPFFIIEGARLWEQSFGVPNSAGENTNSVPEVRKFILQQANYLRGHGRDHLRLYLRLTDATEAKSLRVFPIGQLLSFSRPDPQVDKDSNLHILYANGPSSYNYIVFNHEGELIERQTFDYIATRPRLKPNEDGTIKVSGGSRRFTANDFPARKTDSGPDATKSKP